MFSSGLLETSTAIIGAIVGEAVPFDAWAMSLSIASLAFLGTFLFQQVCGRLVKVRSGTKGCHATPKRRCATLCARRLDSPCFASSQIYKLTIFYRRYGDACWVPADEPEAVDEVEDPVFAFLGMIRIGRSPLRIDARAPATRSSQRRWAALQR